MRRSGLAVLVAAGVVLAALAPATARAPVTVDRPGPVAAADPAPPVRAGPPVYRDPRTYDGLERAPRVRPLVGRKRLLSESGVDPDVYVDEAGTAHIVWNEGRGDGADEAVYCRLKRGAASCDTTEVLSWDKTYGAGDGPQYNTDDLGPKIVRVGNTLLVLSFRYPTGADKPDGASSHNLVGWVSNDGGTSWDDATIFGKQRLGELVVAGPDNDPVVINLGQDPFCDAPGGIGQSCLTGIRSGGYAFDSGTLSPVPEANYSQSMTRHDGQAVAALSNAGVGTTSGEPWSIWVSRWTGTEPVIDPATWETSAPIPGDEPDVAGGPRGLYLMARGWDARGFLGPLQVRRVGVPTADGADVGLGRPATLAEVGTFDHELFQDAGGGLHAAYVRQGQIVLSTTMPEADPTGVPGFLPPVVLGAAGPHADPVAIGATDDGGGFVTYAGADGVVAAGFGSTAPTGLPGIADIPGGGNVSCKNVDFGQFQITTVAGCFFRGTGSQSHLVVTRSAVVLNGVEIVPTAGSQLVIDAERLRIDTVGQAHVYARNADATIELFRGEIHRDLAGLRPGDRLFEFAPDQFAADILGFPSVAGLPVQLTEDGVRIPFEVGLPPALGAFTGKGVLRLTTGDGLVLESLQVKLGPLNLGVLELGAELDWQQGGTWTGSGHLRLPAGGRIDVQVGFVGGDFDHATANYQPQPPITIGPFVYLTDIGGGLFLTPDTRIDIRASIGAGAPVQGLHPVKATGTASMVFPSQGPATFRLLGDVELFGVSLSESELRFRTDGYATYHGTTHLDIGPLSGSVTTDGFVDARAGEFGVRFGAGASICVTVEDPTGVNPPTLQCDEGGADAAMSTRGFAACASALGASAGIELEWADVSPAVLAVPSLLVIELIEAFAVPCSTSDFFLPPPARWAARPDAHATPAEREHAERVGRALRAGAAFAVPPGLPSSTFRIDGGTEQVPDVVVTAPDGTQVVGPEATGDEAVVVSVEGSDHLWVMTAAPDAGVWTVEPAAGEPPLAEVAVSEGYRPARVSGSVGTQLRKGKVVVRYRTRNLTGDQSAVLRETGAFGTRIVGRLAPTRGPATTYAFRPAGGRGGVRAVEVVIRHDGVDQRVVELGTFRAPQPRAPAPPSRLRAVKKGSRLAVSWLPPRGADRVEVRATGSAGSAVARQVGGTARKLVLDGWKWDRRVTVRVRAWSADGLRSGWRTVRIPS